MVAGVTISLKSQWLSRLKVYFLFNLLPRVGAGDVCSSQIVLQMLRLHPYRGSILLGPSGPRTGTESSALKTGKKEAWRLLIVHL